MSETKTGPVEEPKKEETVTGGPTNEHVTVQQNPPVEEPKQDLPPGCVAAY